MTRLLIIKLFVIATFCELISCSGYFTVVGPKLLRHNGKYSVAITSRNYENSNVPTLEVGIQNFNRSWKVAQNITLINGKSQTLDFNIEDQPIDDYTLGVKSIIGQHFDKVVKLNMNTKNVSIFVQTDKAIYKPADLVQFRVLALNQNLKPLDKENLIQVHITDGGQNRVKQFDSVTFVKGVFQGEFKLSDLPVLGDWHIHVSVNHKIETTKVFEVAEYTLPNFEVTIDVNPDANYDERKIKATVVAKHTFGKIAKGNVTITGEVGFFKSSKSVEVNGKKTLEFDMEKDFGLKEKFTEKIVKFFASFTEELTGRVQNATANVVIHITPHKMKLTKSSNKFKPGLPFTIKAVVQYHDKNAPVTDSHTPVKFTTTLRYANNYRGHEKVNEVYSSNGIFELDIDIPKNITQLDVKAQYLETAKSINNIGKSQSESNRYINIKAKTETPTLAQNVQLNILSTNTFNEFSYHVLNNKGDVVASETIEILPSKSTDFEFTPTFDMIPKAKVVVFYITNDGEIISDSLELEFDNELRNFIDIQVPKNQMSPSELVDISITTNPNSFVGLLGVDQSVLVLKKGNDIEETAVFDELGQYNKVNKEHQKWISDYDEKSYSDFKSSEIVIITNAKKEYKPSNNYFPYYLPWRYSSGPPGRYGSSYGNVAASSYSGGFTPTSGLISNHGYNRFQGQPLMSISTDEAINDIVIPPRETEIRREFPETWLYDILDFEVNQTNAIISRKVPDSITSWIITGFSIDPVTGLGLTKRPTKFKVFQPFFVSLNLPYSIKRGEIISIPISVFNYMDTDQTAQVTLYNEDFEFEFVEVKQDEKRATQNLKTKNLLVKSESGTSTTFMIRPQKIGHIKIKVVAISQVAGDGAERQLIVEPEGVTQYMNKPVFIDLRSSNEYKADININIPSNAVPDSTRIEATAIGDILGPSIENLDKLIKLPYGCGEQNMLNFVPNIVVLDYLIAVNKLTPEIKEKAKKFLETGYQRELTYKHDDGSYSVWGKRDKSGSTWLTAFVAKSFHQASKYILVDTEIIEQALRFLSKVQSEDGSFAEVGYLFDRNIQGGVSNGIALTAYTLVTFLENTDFVETYKSTIDRALEFLNVNYHNITDNYSLAIVSYALQLADHNLKNVLFSKLEKAAITEGGTMHWEKNAVESEVRSANVPNSLSIEMSAYALQAFMKADRLTDAVKIMKWLVSQRNGNGGFSSTQDTVVGLQALAKLATNMYTPNNNVDILITHTNNDSLTLHVNERNAMILQKHELPSTARDFQINAAGNGFAIFQLSYQYNIDTSAKNEHRFIVSPVVNTTSNKNFLHLKVCTNFVPDETTLTSNMAVMEVTFPSGFTFDTDFLPELESTKEVKKVEYKDRKTVVIVYFDVLSSTSVCPEFVAFRTNSVAMQKPASIVVYDYYDTTHHGISFYNLPEISVCDICDDDAECLQDCEDMITNDV